MVYKVENKNELMESAGACLSEPISPLDMAPTEQETPPAKAKDSKRWLKPLSGAIAAALTFGACSSSNNGENSSIARTATTEASTDTTDTTNLTPDTTMPEFRKNIIMMPDNMDRKKAQSDFDLAIPIYVDFLDYNPLPTEQNVRLLFWNLEMGFLKGDQGFFRAIYGDDFDPYGVNKGVVDQANEIQKIRDEENIDILPDVNYYFGPDNEISQPISRDTANASVFYVDTMEIFRRDGGSYEETAVHKNHVKIELKIEYSQDAEREIWTIGTLTKIKE